jgi:CheY-like chemotaxis protein
MVETKTVLVIEDDELNMKLVRAVLKTKEFHMIEAVDGETGLKMVKDFEPDLILLDINLPDMDGYSVARKIRGSLLKKEIPIIALTALAMPEDLVNAREAGCVDCVTKPFHVQELLDTLERYISC